MFVEICPTSRWIPLLLLCRLTYISYKNNLIFIAEVSESFLLTAWSLQKPIRIIRFLVAYNLRFRDRNIEFDFEVFLQTSYLNSAIVYNFRILYAKEALFWNFYSNLNSDLDFRLFSGYNFEVMLGIWLQW